jgi:hypothetical protein
MTAAKNDWRLSGQERYLQGRSWSRRRYTGRRPGWDHDHCSFCYAKLMEGQAADVLDEGYATEDGYYWVCPSCFEDFREMFAWKLTEGS